MIALILRKQTVHCGKIHHLEMASNLLNKQSRSSSSSRDPAKYLKHEDSSSAKVSKEAYQEAIRKLNSIQSTSEELDKFRKIENGIVNRLVGPHCVKQMPVYFQRCGIDVEEIHRIPMIHVAGTKGKGSVCAFTESILRKYGLKTGLLTSPHLIEVRERIRVNGKPLDYDKFASYFSEVFDRLDETKEDFGGEMPLYNRILCVLGFYTFLKEKVDVAVIEVGLGGQYDVTNFIREPIVTGISSLGMDHVKSLGDTIAKIAWHKAGILKPGRPAFTVPQPEDAMKVILNRAKEIGTSIQCVPEFDEHEFGKQPVQLGIAGKCQPSNATLAIHLCHQFLECTNMSKSGFKEVSPDTHPPSKKLKVREEESKTDLSNGFSLGMTTSEPLVLPDEFISGLRDCYWPGRSQTIVRDKVTYYVDGAHTRRSIESCVEWFLEASDKETAAWNGSTVKMLVFNLKAQKYKQSLITPLLGCRFVGAAFCPSYIYEGDNPEDLTFAYKARDIELRNSQDIKQKFEDLEATFREASCEARLKEASSEETLREVISEERNMNNSNQSLQPNVEKQDLNLDSSKLSSKNSTNSVKCVVLPSISSALRWASAGKDNAMGSPGNDVSPIPEAAVKADHIQVLVTGSLYLVGGALTLLDPELASK